MDDRRAKLEAQLSAYLDGELTDAERAEVEVWLAVDAEARALLADLERIAGGLHALPRAHAASDMLESIRTRMERQALLGDTAAAPGTGRTSGSRTGRWAAAAAIVLLSSVAGYVSWLLNTSESIRSRISSPLAMFEREHQPGSGARGGRNAAPTEVMKRDPRSDKESVRGGEPVSDGLAAVPAVSAAEMRGKGAAPLRDRVHGKGYVSSPRPQLKAGHQEAYGDETMASAGEQRVALPDGRERVEIDGLVQSVSDGDVDVITNNAPASQPVTVLTVAFADLGSQNQVLNELKTQGAVTQRESFGIAYTPKQARRVGGTMLGDAIQVTELDLVVPDERARAFVVARLSESSRSSLGRSKAASMGGASVSNMFRSEPNLYFQERAAPGSQPHGQNEALYHNFQLQQPPAGTQLGAPAAAATPAQNAAIDESAGNRQQSRSLLGRSSTQPSELKWEDERAGKSADSGVEGEDRKQDHFATSEPQVMADRGSKDETNPVEEVQLKPNQPASTSQPMAGFGGFGWYAGGAGRRATTMPVDAGYVLLLNIHVQEPAGGVSELTATSRSASGPAETLPVRVDTGTQPDASVLILDAPTRASPTSQRGTETRP